MFTTFHTPQLFHKVECSALFLHNTIISFEMTEMDG